MTNEELAKEYQNQADILNAKIKTLEPLLKVYRGTELYLLRKKIKTYYDMAEDCMTTAYELGELK